MNSTEALQAIIRGEKLDQSTIKRLYREGYIEVRDVAHMQSPEQEFLPTCLTEKASGSWRVWAKSRDARVPGMNLIESDASLAQVCRSLESRLQDIGSLDGIQLRVELLPNFEGLPIKPEERCAYDPKTCTILINGSNFFELPFDCQSSALAHEIGHHVHDSGLIGRATHYEMVSRCIVADWLACTWGLFEGLRDDCLKHYGAEYCEIFAVAANEKEFFHLMWVWNQVFLCHPQRTRAGA